MKLFGWWNRWIEKLVINELLWEEYKEKVLQEEFDKRMDNYRKKRGL